MATTAAAYGCSAAAALPFPGSPFTRSSPPSRVHVASSNPMPGTPAPRSLRVSCRRRRLYVCACSGEVGPDNASAASPAGASFDIKLPRRSLLVKFTCTKCDARTERLINRVAYERGTVFLQCAGCQVYHKFVDNLGLIVEYDLREENGVNTCTED
ncbi:uncharacterized protein LOC119363279 [Triticum dicoccoides]|uniref:uncharacterized protein LOC119363279 n=1 Tax=Triticum dicoccoides TaxID=85692 RepID=UPI00162E4720|nr:uncharacterized protein LOC119363279 [Triticum dicoccoides]